MNHAYNRYSLILDNLPDAYAYHEVIHDQNGQAKDYRFLEVNEAFAEMTALDCSQIIGRKVSEVLPGITDSAFDWISVYGRVAQECGQTWFEQYSEPLGRWYEVYAFSHEPGFFVTIFRDVTKYKKAELELQESKRKYRDILANMQEAYFELDIQGNILDCNQAAAELVHANLEEITGMNILEMCADPQTTEVRINRVVYSGHAEYSAVFSLVCLDGAIIHADFSLDPVVDEQGNIAGLRAIGRDITQRKEYEKQLEHLSLHDQLTGLYNRAYFENEMERLSKSREYPITILSIDLDGLKLVNDTMGHKQGDNLLVACAGILKKSFRTSDVLARVGGDEFAAILPRTGQKNGEAIIDRIIARVKSYNHGQNDHFPLSLSIGQATAEDVQRDLVEAFKEADDLMYRDKLHKGVDTRSQIISSLLTVMREKENITQGNTQQLEELCRLVGQELGLSKKQLSDLTLLAHVHDLGKVGVPDKILSKQGPLSEEEWAIMRQHPEKGYRIALSSKNLTGIADLILKHHERWDGKGYPLGIKGQDIPIECRILAIADAFEAMTHERPYQAAMTQGEAIRELWRCSGAQFDPGLVQVFVRVVARQDDDVMLGQGKAVSGEN
jgi:diguanylate cyclase (GGDEF)-like protein/PAS domain S-box-containing protein